eukprot:m51a1_g7186 putative serine threonine-protein kinase mark2 isoform x3 (701) ;mRNA; r:97348-99849
MSERPTDAPPAVLSPSDHSASPDLSSSGSRKHHTPRHRRRAAASSLSDKSIGANAEYALEKTLGEGQFGKVKLATHRPSGAKVAVKIINKVKLGPDSLRLVLREVAILKELRHPNIIRLYEVIDTPEHMYLVMEHAAGGEVMDHILAHGRLRERDACRFFAQTAFALQYCHASGIVHRDLKAENILLDEAMNVKLIDFGLSNHYCRGGLLSTFCGSPTYASPELVQRHEYEGPEVDCWSLGVLLYVLVCGFLPFDGSSFVDLYQKIIEAKYRIPGHVSPSCADLIRKMLVPEVVKRATIEEIVAHEWITSHGHTPPSEPPRMKLVRTTDDANFEILGEMSSKLGARPADVIRSLCTNAFDSSYATYYLLLDRRTRRASSQAPQHAHATSAVLTPQTLLTVPVTPPAVRRDPSPLVLNPVSSSSPAAASSPAISRARAQSTADYATAVLSPSSGPATGPPVPLSSLSSRLDRRSCVSSPLNQRARSKNASSPSRSSFSFLSISKRVRSTSREPARPPPAYSESPPSVPARSMSPPGMSSSVGSQEDAARELQRRSRRGSINAFIASVLGRRGSGHEAVGQAAAAAQGSGAAAQSQALTSHQEPRAVRFAFSVKTTSARPAVEVLEEVVRVLHETPDLTLDEERSISQPFMFRCESGSGMQFEIEICRIPRLSLRGLRFHRIAGDSWEYKNLCKEILAKLHL